MTSGVSRVLLATLVGAAIGVGGWYLQTPKSESVADKSAVNASVTAAPGDTANGSAPRPAVSVALPKSAPLLGAARAGSRAVAVGDHGVVLLSDDQGKSWRQARSVPTQALLTSVFFVDDKQGWIAGHDGVILHSTDGGETWAMQRQDLSGDKPLLSIFFKDAAQGFAVGLFGTALQTADGGRSWTSLAVESGDENDHHLYAIFGDPASALVIASESGLLYRSTDGGTTWSAVQTRNSGSFWAGARLADGSLLAVGLHGHIFRSADAGQNWSEIASGITDSLTAVAILSDSAVRIVGLAGANLSSSDGGKTFTAAARADRAPLTALLAGSPEPLLFGGNGISATELRKPR